MRKAPAKVGAYCFSNLIGTSGAALSLIIKAPLQLPQCNIFPLISLAIESGTAVSENCSKLHFPALLCSSIGV